MEKIPGDVLEKIDDYIIDLFRKDHIEKFKSTLICIRIHCLYVLNRWDCYKGISRN